MLALLVMKHQYTSDKRIADPPICIFSRVMSRIDDTRMSRLIRSLAETPVFIRSMSIVPSPILKTAFIVRNRYWIIVFILIVTLNSDEAYQWRDRLLIAALQLWEVEMPRPRHVFQPLLSITRTKILVDMKWQTETASKIH